MSYFEKESEQKIVKCPKCKSLRNIVIAPECPICQLRKQEIQKPKKEMEKDYYLGKRKYYKRSELLD
jgi:hypothetical protein